MWQQNDLMAAKIVGYNRKHLVTVLCPHDDKVRTCLSSEHDAIDLHHVVIQH